MDNSENQENLEISEFEIQDALINRVKGSPESMIRRTNTPECKTYFFHRIIGTAYRVWENFDQVFDELGLGFIPYYGAIEITVNKEIRPDKGFTAREVLISLCGEIRDGSIGSHGSQQAVLAVRSVEFHEGSAGILKESNLFFMKDIYNPIQNTSVVLKIPNGILRLESSEKSSDYLQEVKDSTVLGYGGKVYKRTPRFIQKERIDEVIQEVTDLMG